MFSLRLGSTTAVVINGWPAVKQALASDQLLGRPEPSFLGPFNIDANIVDGSGNLLIVWVHN